jgi:hypothetical protein
MTLSAIPYVLVSLAIFGLVLIVFGTLMDEILIVDNQIQLDPTLPYSAERGNTMNNLVFAMRAMGFIALIVAGILLLMNATQDQSGAI